MKKLIALILIMAMAISFTVIVAAVEDIPPREDWGDEDACAGFATMILPANLGDWDDDYQFENLIIELDDEDLITTNFGWNGDEGNLELWFNHSEDYVDDLNLREFAGTTWQGMTWGSSGPINYNTSDVLIHAIQFIADIGVRDATITLTEIITDNEGNPILDDEGNPITWDWHPLVDGFGGKVTIWNPDWSPEDTIRIAQFMGFLYEWNPDFIEATQNADGSWSFYVEDFDGWSLFFALIQRGVPVEDAVRVLTATARSPRTSDNGIHAGIILLLVLASTGTVFAISAKKARQQSK